MLLTTLFALEPNKTSHVEKWVSAIGGLTGIFAIAVISEHFIGTQNATWLVASMGATAVLVFAVPHGPLSQPWPVIGGHCLSALIGVSCAQWIPQVIPAAAISVSMAILAMHYLRCIHPPGGATALTAVIAGSNVSSLGYSFIITPVLMNALAITLIAVIFNLAFPWRRYPTVFANLLDRKNTAGSTRLTEHDALSHSDINAALKSIDSTIDISARDLETVYRLAKHHARSASLNIQDIVPGSYYSNGRYGRHWQVRQIIDWEYPKKQEDGLVIYKVVAGKNRRTTNKTTLGQFASWSRYEVFLNENSWQRVIRGESMDATCAAPNTGDLS